MTDEHETVVSSKKQEPTSDQSAISKPCSHADVNRSFGDMKSCFSCGEIIGSLLDQSSITASESSSDDSDNDDDDDDDDDDDQAWDFEVEHASAVTIFQPQGYNEKFVRRKGSYGFSALQLDKKEIRLVLLEPGKPNEQVTCSIFHAVLGSWNQPSYEAVSYTWADENGDCSFSRILHCGNEEVPITRNCEAALKRLRHERQQRRIWIDQLCIDQSDIAERGHQVGLMSEIYAGADQVLIYLGHNISFAQDLLSYITGFVSAPADRMTDEIWRLSWRPSILRVISTSWFTRIWVLQEIACAKKALLLTSDALVPWGRLRAFIDAFQNIDPIGSTKSLPGPLNFGLRHLATAGQLFDMLVSTNNCNAGDPRDKVFALYGIIMGAADHGLEADYSKSPEQVFLETARRIVESASGLRILSHAKGGEHSTLDLPSWVPDWGTRRRRPLAEELKSELGMPQSNAIKYDFMPSLFKREPTFRITVRPYHWVGDRNARQLKLSGLCLDIVTGIGSGYIPTGTYCDQCRSQYLKILQWAADQDYYLFATTNFFGFSTNDVEAGDSIWHFDDTTKAYFVCRDLEGCTTLVGECFLCALSYHRCCMNSPCSSTRSRRCDICRGYMSFQPTDIIMS